MKHVLHTARISNDDRVLYNDTETLMARLLSHLLGSYLTDVLHTAWFSDDEWVLYNDTETIIVRVNILSYLLVSYVTRVLHTARISNDERVLHIQWYEDTYKDTSKATNCPFFAVLPSKITAASTKHYIAPTPAFDRRKRWDF